MRSGEFFDDGIAFAVAWDEMNETVGFGGGKQWGCWRKGDKIETKDVGTPPAVGIKGDQDLPKGSEGLKACPGLQGWRRDELWGTAGSGNVEKFRPLEVWPRSSNRFLLLSGCKKFNLITSAWAEVSFCSKSSFLRFSLIPSGNFPGDAGTELETGKPPQQMELQAVD